MDSEYSPAVEAVCFAIGLFLGKTLIFALGQVNRLVVRFCPSRQPVFSRYGYWSLVGVALLCIDIFGVRRSGVGVQFSFALCLYLGVGLPFVLQAGWPAKAIDHFRRQAPRSIAVPLPAQPAGGFTRAVFSSKTLSRLALLCWIASLCLPASVFLQHAGPDYMTGARILFSGWLAMLQLQFAWLANPLLLIAYIRLQRGQSAWGFAVAAMLLSLQTFKAQALAQDYGYGWGMVLWFMSLAMMVAAVGAPPVRGTRLATVARIGWLRPLGLLMFCAIGLTAGVIAHDDRQGANHAEIQRLESAAIKRGEVCRVELAHVTPPAQPLVGPLQVNLRSAGGLVAGFHGLQGLIDWPVPIVRYQGRDYFYARSGDEVLLDSIPAQGEPAATLDIDNGPTDRHLRLQVGHQRPLFEQRWTLINGKKESCPDDTFPAGGAFNGQVIEYSQHMIEQALGLAKPPAPTAGAVLQPLSEWAGRVLSRTRVDGAAHELLLNTHCPPGTGWARDSPQVGVVTNHFTDNFWIGERAYHLASPYSGRSICQGDAVFVYDSTATGHGQAVLTLEKRRLADFARVSTTRISVDDSQLNAEPLQIDTLEESAQGMILDVRQPGQGLSLRVLATAG